MTNTSYYLFKWDRRYISWICFDSANVLLFENDLTFEWTEDDATVFLKWMDFKSFMKSCELILKLEFDFRNTWNPLCTLFIYSFACNMDVSIFYNLSQSWIPQLDILRQLIKNDKYVLGPSVLYR